MLLGGTISGAGVLSAGGTALRGFGTINTAIDFDSPSNLFADDGTLTINGSILDVGRIGTDDADGVLNVVNPWNTNVAQFVQLEGGTIQGGTMTIDNVNAVSGFGTIASRVINNEAIRASGGTLVVQTAGNDNDWDGATNDASLHAQSNSMLELRDNLTFGFTGTVSMFPGGRVFANGFALDFNPGSSLFLNSDAMYESNRSTDLGGVVTTSAGPASTIKILNNFFLTFESTSSTTLVADLRLENNNIIIEQGATFGGGGALVIPDGSHVVGENLANIGVLLDMQGAFRPGNSEGIGRVDLFDYQQAQHGRTVRRDSRERPSTPLIGWSPAATWCWMAISISISTKSHRACPSCRRWARHSTSSRAIPWSESSTTPMFRACQRDWRSTLNTSATPSNFRW